MLLRNRPLRINIWTVLHLLFDTAAATPLLWP
jgi:hypothetical protein